MLNKRSTLLFSLILISLAATLSITNVSHIAKSAGATTQASTTAGTYFDHVVVVIMEDHGIQQICGSSPPPCQRTMGPPHTAGPRQSHPTRSPYLGQRPSTA